MKQCSLILSIFLLIIPSFACISCKDMTKDDSSQNDNVNYRDEMRLFVQNISAYAKKLNPNFIVIPQNGHELLTQNGEPDGNLSLDYINAIDAVGREDLFYGYSKDDVETPVAETNEMISFLNVAKNNGLKVMVTDYCYTENKMKLSYDMNYSNEFVSFAADHRELDNIPLYPTTPNNVTSNSITNISEIKNFLYLINPSQFATEAIFKNAISMTNYDLVLIDLFYHSQVVAVDSLLSTKQNGGSRLVIAYMSIGEAEDYRYYWNADWSKNAPAWLAGENSNWPGNYKVKYWNKEWQDIIYGNDLSYIKKIIDAGYNGVYLDIIDAYEYFENKRKKH